MSESTQSRFNYPFAASPDIIRANQKDAYFVAQLQDRLASILRRLRGARVAHANAQEVGTAASLLYLALTTLVGNRTLGEEYCDIVQVEAGRDGDGSGSGVRLPAVKRRLGYIVATVLLPYWLGRGLPALRRRLRASLEAGLRKDSARSATESSDLEKRREGPAAPSPTSPSTRLVRTYLLTNLDALTSPAPIYAVSLAAFYFSGAYYHLGKRLLGLRYIFTRRVQLGEQRAGYEVLGFLLVMQLAVQAYLHVQQTVADSSIATDTIPQHLDHHRHLHHGHQAVSLDPQSYTSNNALLFSTDPSSSSSAHPSSRLQTTTHTPVPSDGNPRHDLTDADTMAWIGAGQQRKCTLCLEEMRDPSVTACGHVFCWTCIGDWCREKPECPLCRQPSLVQRILPLRG